MAVQAIVVCSSRTGGRVLPPYASAALLLVGLAVPGPDVPLVGRHHPFRRLFLAPSHPMAAKDLPTYDRDVAKPRRCWTRPVYATQRRRNPGPVWRPAVRAGAAHRQPVHAQDRRAGHGVPPRGERPGQVHQLGRGLGRRATTRGNYDWRSSATAPWVGTRTPPLRIRLSARVPAKSFCSTFGYDNSQFEDLAARQAAKLDPSRRKEAVQQIQRIVAEDAPLIPLYLPTRLLIFDQRTFGALVLHTGRRLGAYPGPETSRPSSPGPRP